MYLRFCQIGVNAVVEKEKEKEEVPLERKKKKKTGIHIASLTSEAINKCLGGLTICLNRFSHMHINRGVHLHDM